jgi:hypothetical protein
MERQVTSIVILGIIKIPPAIVLIPLWVLTYYVHKKIWYIYSTSLPKDKKMSSMSMEWIIANPEEYREHKKFKYLFIMLWIIQGSIMLYMLFKPII